MTGMYPNADRTAPGGMSRKAIIAELVDEHGYEDSPEWADVSWPALIELLINERKEREAEQPEPEPEDEEDEDADEIEQANAADPNPGYFNSVPNMFDDLGPDPMIDHEAEHDVEVILAELDDAPVALVEEALHDAGVDSDVLDPEALFAEMVEAREADTPPPVFIGLPGVKDYLFNGHAGAGPSGAERWMNCTMSLSASRKFLETLTPNQQALWGQGNTAARQGTTAHSAAEAKAEFALGRTDESELDATLTELAFYPENEDEAYDEEMSEYITEYVDLVKTYAQERSDDHVLIESRVEAAIPLTDLHEGEVYVIRGSADLAVMPVKGRVKKALRSLVVGDLKYGNGLDVDVEENPQIRIYALGVLDLLVGDDGQLPEWLDEIVYHIVQPRLGGIKTWTETVDDLLTWRDETLAPALTKALYGANEGATFEPSDLACQWCPARGACPALAQARMDSATDLFDVVLEAEFEGEVGSVPDPTTLDDKRLGELLAQAKAVKDLYSDLREEAQRRLHRGATVPGFHLVNYTPARAWKGDAAKRLDPSLTVEEGRLPLPDEALAKVWKDPVLVTPTQAQKVLGDEGYALIEALVDKPDKRPVISTGANDNRKKWEGKPPEAMFADETDMEN